MSEVTIVHNPERHRYEAHLDGEMVGFSHYRLHDGIIEFTHTEVDDDVEGHGVGSTLARYALDDVRRDGTRAVVASCPFIKEWIEHHPDYADLLDAA